MDITTTGPLTPLQPQKAEQETGFEAFGKDGFTFYDFLDIINPLQHIPLLNTAYRSLTGDEIDPGSKIAGGTLFGGPIGAVASLTDVAVEQTTGQDMGEHAFAWFKADENEQVASLEPAPGSQRSSFSPLSFAPGPGVDISQWAATAGTGGVDHRPDLQSSWANSPSTSQQVAEATIQASVAPPPLPTPPLRATAPTIAQSNLAALKALSADLRQAKSAQMVANYGAIQNNFSQAKATQANDNGSTQPFTRRSQNNDGGMVWFSHKMKDGLEKYTAAGQLKTPAIENNSKL